MHRPARFYTHFLKHLHSLRSSPESRVRSVRAEEGRCRSRRAADLRSGPARLGLAPRSPACSPSSSDRTPADRTPAPVPWPPLSSRAFSGFLSYMLTGLQGRGLREQVADTQPPKQACTRLTAEPTTSHGRGRLACGQHRTGPDCRRLCPCSESPASSLRPRVPDGTW